MTVEPALGAATNTGPRLAPRATEMFVFVLPHELAGAVEQADLHAVVAFAQRVGIDGEARLAGLPPARHLARAQALPVDPQFNERRGHAGVADGERRAVQRPVDGDLRIDRERVRARGHRDKPGQRDGPAARLRGFHFPLMTPLVRGTPGQGPFCPRGAALSTSRASYGEGKRNIPSLMGTGHPVPTSCMLDVRGLSNEKMRKKSHKPEHLV